jgi:hypothetical protein
MSDIEEWTDDELHLLRLGYGGGFTDGFHDANSHLDPPPTFEKFRYAHISEGFMDWLDDNPKVAKFDPLVVLCDHIGLGHTDTEDMANDLRAALKARGQQIVEVKNDD